MEKNDPNIDARPDQGERLAWLTLARSQGIGPIGFFELIDHFGSATTALENIRDGNVSGRFRQVSLASPADVEAELECIEKAGAILLTADEEGYPYRLRHIADPPPVITVRGDVSILHQPSVALVGARNASANGCRFAKNLARSISGENLAVVSGLARGIDTAAHNGALEAQCLTVAAIASGADIAYPPENAGLMEAIAERGAVVSERPWGAIAKSKHFPARNRIIVGLSLGTVVIEAAMKSGSLISARLAAEYGREVLAVPGSPGDPRHRGTNKLLRDGAHFVEDPSDVLDVLLPLAASHQEHAPALRKRSSKSRIPSAKKNNPDAKIERMSLVSTSSDGTGELRETLVELLSVEPVAVDELIRQCHASPSVVLDCLLDLELEEVICRHAGNRVSLVVR